MIKKYFITFGFFVKLHPTQSNDRTNSMEWYPSIEILEQGAPFSS